MNKDSFMYKHNLPFIILVGLSLSLASAIWAFLLSIAESQNGNFALVAITMALGLLPLSLVLYARNRRNLRLSRYAVLTGIFFGLANGVLMSIFSYRDSAIIYSLISPTVLVFIILQILVNRKTISRGGVSRLAAGGAAATVGFVSLAFSSLNTTLISGYDIFLSIILIVLYGAAGFFLMETGLKSKNTGGSMLIIGVSDIITMLLFLPFSGLKFSYIGLPYSFLAGVIVSAGIAVSFLGYTSLQGSKKALPYSSIIYILSESDTLILVLFYTLFVGRLNLYIIASVLLISAAIWYLSKEADTSLK